MSGTLFKSSDKYEEDTIRGQVSTVTDRIVTDTQQADTFEPEMLNEQSNSHNLANLEDEDGDRVDTDQLPPHWIIETVSYEDYVKQRDVEIVEERVDGDNIEVIELDDDDEVEEVNRDQASGSTSTGNRKRKSSSTSQSANNDKRQKIVTTDGSKKHQCKSPGCGNSIVTIHDLSRHERIHLGIKPFSCSWPNCRYSAVRKAHIVLHVRTQHFKLPKLQKEQERLNIVDNRNPEDYVQVNNQLLERRLE